MGGLKILGDPWLFFGRRQFPVARIGLEKKGEIAKVATVVGKGRQDVGKSRVLVYALGGPVKVARAFGITPQAVSGWLAYGIPGRRMPELRKMFREEVEKAFGPEGRK